MFGNLASHKRSASGYSQPSYQSKSPTKSVIKQPTSNIFSQISARGIQANISIANNIPGKKLDGSKSIKNFQSSHIRSESFNNISSLKRTSLSRSPTPSKLKQTHQKVPPLAINKIKPGEVKEGPPTTRTNVTSKLSNPNTNREKSKSRLDNSFNVKKDYLRNTSINNKGDKSFDLNNSYLNKSLNKSRVCKTPTPSKNDRLYKPKPPPKKVEINNKYSYPVLYSLYMKKINPTNLIRFPSKNKKVFTNTFESSAATMKSKNEKKEEFTMSIPVKYDERKGI